MWLIGHTLFADGGRPGSVVVTIVFVVAGVLLQFAFGLGLAYLVTLGLPGQRFFRVVLLLPMTITPVGVAYMFRMMMDTDKGPLEPIFAALGLENLSWATSAWGARAAVIIGDTWQWTPFMFIVLLAALEGQDLEPIEAATMDGANRWQILRYITMPAIFPVALTIILLRLIEAFKIIDLPNVLTSGGPGTATESLTLQSYFHWRSLDLGISAATANSLMVLVTIIAVIYVHAPCGGGSWRNESARPSLGDRRLAQGQARRLPHPRILGADRAVPPLLARDHLVQAADRRGHRPEVHPVRRLPAHSRCLAIHLRPAAERHAPSLREFGRRDRPELDVSVS